MFDLSSHVALVTGAGQGMGFGVAQALASQGANVAVNDLDPDRAATAAARITREGGAAFPVPFDITDVSAVRAALADIRSAVGPIDVLVNNAGVPATMALQPFLDTTPEDWRPYVELNMYGSMHCIQAVAPGMLEAGWGRIIQISSAAGHTGIRLGVGPYGASKAGIEGLLRNLAVEIGPQGITVNAVVLGMMDNVPAEMVADLSARVPMRRLGGPADVGAAVVYLASDEAGYVTGQTLHVNGGTFIA